MTSVSTITLVLKEPFDRDFHIGPFALALVERGLVVGETRRISDTLMMGGSVNIDVPGDQDIATLIEELRKAGVLARVGP
jgi:hypothetical protein